MNKKLRIFVIPVMLLIFTFAGTTMNVIAVDFPYSVSVGDKIPYTVSILKNGTSVESLFVQGLNLSQGDTFEMEIFDSPANPTSYWGSDFDVRFIKGEEKGVVFDANSILFTNNKTFWSEFSNTTIDIGGTVYQVVIESNTGTFSWTTDADNLVVVKFATNDGVMTSFERKTTSSVFNYTHFKFEKGTGTISGFEVSIIIPSAFLVAVIGIIRTKKKS